MRHILVVDDEVLAIRILKKSLKGDDRSIVVAQSAEEALEKLEDVDFNLIFSDCHMTGMTGLQFAENARAAGFKRVFILNSGALIGKAENEQLRNLMQDGSIQAFIEKPWHLHELRELVNSALALDMATQVLPSKGNDT